MKRITDKTNVFRENLLYEIGAGRYRPLEKLPSERLFCERYQISRTTARRALEELELEGIIERRPPIGAFVRAQALEIIGRRQVATPTLSVSFVMPPDQLNNPLIQIIFMTCRQYLDAKVKLAVVFDDLCLPISLRGEQTDIVVVHGIPVDDRLRRLRKEVGTMVLLNTSNDDFNYITADNYGGGRMMAEYIIKSGHRSIGCVGPGGPEDQSDFIQRYYGIRDVCQAAGIKLERTLLSMENYFNLSASCHQALDNLLIRQPSMSAVLALYDMIAVYLCESLYLRGLKIPADMSVMGFDDQFYARYTVPPLTTIKYPAEAVGMKLAQFIQDAAEDKTTGIQEIIAPLLVARNPGSVRKRESKRGPLGGPVIKKAVLV